MDREHGGPQREELKGLLRQAQEVERERELERDPRLGVWSREEFAERAAELRDDVSEAIRDAKTGANARDIVRAKPGLQEKIREFSRQLDLAYPQSVKAATLRDYEKKVSTIARRFDAMTPLQDPDGEVVELPDLDAAGRIEEIGQTTRSYTTYRAATLKLSKNEIASFIDLMDGPKKASNAIRRGETYGDLMLTRFANAFGNFAEYPPDTRTIKERAADANTRGYAARTKGRKQSKELSMKVRKRRTAKLINEYSELRDGIVDKSVRDVATYTGKGPEALRAKKRGAKPGPKSLESFIKAEPLRALAAPSVSLICGARPQEVMGDIKVGLVRSDKTERLPYAIKIQIGGAKLGPHSGQEKREMEIELDPHEQSHRVIMASVMRLNEMTEKPDAFVKNPSKEIPLTQLGWGARLQKMGVEPEDMAKKYGKWVRSCSERAWKSAGMHGKCPVSAYTMRHAFASRAKHQFLIDQQEGRETEIDELDVSRALGHQSAKMKGHYGNPRSANGRSQKIAKVSATSPIRQSFRHTRIVRYLESADKGPKQK